MNMLQEEPKKWAYVQYCFSFQGLACEGHRHNEGQQDGAGFVPILAPCPIVRERWIKEQTKLGCGLSVGGCVSVKDREKMYVSHGFVLGYMYLVCVCAGNMCDCTSLNLDTYIGPITLRSKHLC